MLSLLNTSFTILNKKGLVSPLLAKLEARSTYFENKICTTAILKKLENIKS